MRVAVTRHMKTLNLIVAFSSCGIPWNTERAADVGCCEWWGLVFLTGPAALAKGSHYGLKVGGSVDGRHS